MEEAEAAETASLPVEESAAPGEMVETLAGVAGQTEPALLPEEAEAPLETVGLESVPARPGRSAVPGEAVSMSMAAMVARATAAAAKAAEVVAVVVVVLVVRTSCPPD